MNYRTGTYNTKNVVFPKPGRKDVEKYCDGGDRMTARFGTLEKTIILVRCSGQFS